MRIFLALLTGLLMVLAPEAPADACGVKLTIKAPRVRKRVQRSDNPSRILLLGEPPRKLAVNLSRSGHNVDVAEEPDDAGRDQYDLVVADPDKVDEARSSYPGTRVVTRTGSTDANVREVERVLARDSSEPRRDRRVVARRSDRDTTPTRSARENTPTGPRRLTPTPAPRREPVPAPIETTPDETTPDETTPDETTPTRVATIPRRDSSPERTEPTRRSQAEDDEPERTREPRRQTRRGQARFTKEIFFGTNSVRLSKRTRKLLAGNVRWLESNSEVSITIEGHTDVSGPAEYNMILGRRRAEAVQAYLVEKGIDESRIEVVSYGEEQPAYGARSSKNRRVVLVTE